MTRLPYPSIPVPNDWDRKGLPAWTYHSEAMFALEREQLFLTHWQLAGHESDIPRPGDWLSFDLLGERAVVMRGADGVVRAFHNLCRHRGARVVAGDAGHCKGSIVCPFHGWVYDLDGALRGPARPSSFGEMDRSEFGLKPVEMEIFHGFVFLRFSPGPQAPVTDLLAPFAADFAAYKLSDVLPAGRMKWENDLPVNWKSVRDVDNEGYHVAMAHPGLQELYGRTYRDLNLANGLTISVGWFGDAPGRGWSVRHYVRHASKRTDLPPHLQNAWTYYGLFPNTVIAVTPEGAQFYQDLPVSVGMTRQTGRLYRHKDETRQTRLARYLSYRIDRATSMEDRQLSIWSNESMKSSSFEGFHLSDLEYGLRCHHQGLRHLMPVMTQAEAPPEYDLARLNHEIKERSKADV
ncbi:MAG: ring-hydroxylating oxygenase subunit alpha [Rhodobacteraceae bacterium CG17_big_fil_post_rev_8_21_14_2_50_63_15]|nr:aromatic ring-hydroxylating dioxygenase subunit alpha [Roseovarius sp.]PIV78987.1 MAG: ring-hydroxylating oxygenase subunit alpha [Rhodobacteraceae bacterium CG17_big_fil_post_rev_8_21_14_2_50_63_15]